MTDAAPPAEPQDNAAETDAPSSFIVTREPDTAAAARTAQQTTEQSPRFHVQVGTFSTREDAEALVRRLQSLGYVATLAEDDTYRVWVGGYFNRETAEALAANMRKAGFAASLVP